MTLSSTKFTEKLELTKESELIFKILYYHIIHSVNTHAHTLPTTCDHLLFKSLWITVTNDDIIT